MDTSIIVGLDIGYGETKGASETSQCACFPSLVAPAERIRFQADVGAPVPVNGTTLYSTQEDDLFVGELAARQGRPGAVRSPRDRDRVANPIVTHLADAALAALLPGRGWRSRRARSRKPSVRSSTACSTASARGCPVSRADWKVKPGSLDSLNSTRLFPAGNPFGIPDLAHTPLAAVPRWLVPYWARVRTTRGDLGEGAVHFFLDDYRFETVWHRPLKALEALAPYRTLLTPDFSLCRDWPLAMQVWSTYRARWCGRFWQAHGFQVIPSVSWSTQGSYVFCFAGIPLLSVVAVSSVGVDSASPLERCLFAAGFQAMVARLRPAAVLSYGPLPRALHALAEIHTYPTRWAGIRAARKVRAS